MTIKEKKAASKKLVKLREKVGKSMKKWRLGQDLVLTQVADKINTSQGSLSDWENGKSLPSFQATRMLKKKYPKSDWDTILFN